MEINQIKIEKISDLYFDEAVDLILEVMNDFGQLPISMREYDDRRYFKLITYDSFKNSELDLYGAFYDGKIIGVMGSNENNIDYFFVKKDYQHQKVGTLLMDNYLRRMKIQNFTKIYVDASHYARDIYKKIGFEDEYKQIEEKSEYQMIYRMEKYNGIY